MKKGLILALTMVAMVALVMPVLALAPLVEPLPNVIIGDNEAGQIDTGSGKHLFTYNNVMNIATSSKIQWRNAALGFGDAQKHAYYMCTPAGGVQVSTPSRLVTEVTTGDVANIMTAGAAPAAAKQITSSAGTAQTSDFYFLSLATNMSGATSSYTATAAANGKTVAQLVTAPVDVTLVVVDGDYPTTAVGTAVGGGPVDPFTVYTVVGGDDGFSGGATAIYTEPFATDQDGWFWKADVGGSIIALGAGTYANGGVTMAPAAGSGIHFGTWASGKPGGVTGAETVIDVSQATMASNILRGTFHLTSTSTNGANTLGFRLLYLSAAFNHLGGVTHYDSGVGADAALDAPTSSSPKDIKVYWAAPFQLAEWSDTGKLATAQAGTDFRDYFINFDAVQVSASDSGSLTLDNVLIEMIAAPSGTPALAWGASPAHAFNDALSAFGWNSGTGTGDAAFSLGTAVIGATNFTITAGANLSYKAVGPFANGTGVLDHQAQAQKLLINTARVATSNVDATPVYRIITLSTTSAGVGLAWIWGDVFDTGSAVTSKNFWGPSAGDAASAPTTGGVDVVSYVFTHSGQAGAKLGPQFDCYNLGPQTGALGNGAWPSANATLTVSSFTMAIAAP